MKHHQSAYQAKRDIAEELAVLGARAVTISAVAKTNPSDSRDLYKQIRKTQSQSGQTPTDHEWFLANRTRRLHGALLLLMYARYRTGLNLQHDGHGLAFALTLRSYHQLFKEEAIVSPERFSLLATNGFAIGWQNIIRGGASKFRSDNVKVMKCRKCLIPHLVEAHFLNFTCQMHQVK
jgi:hypothetical protein